MTQVAAATSAQMINPTSTTGTTAARNDSARRRGQAVLKNLKSTADFTNDRLGVADRKLLLFLVVVLADVDGRLVTCYEKVLRHYQDQPGHWSAGRDVKSMSGYCCKFFGRSAERRPNWTVIEDSVRAAVQPDRVELVLGIAASLYCRAVGKTSPAADYDGPFHTPAWADEDVVTVETITKNLRSPLREIAVGAVSTGPDGTAQPQGEMPAEPQAPDRARDAGVVAASGAELARLQAELQASECDLEKLKTLLDSAIRAFRAADTERIGLVDEVARLKRENAQVRRTNAALRAFHLHTLGTLFPTASEATLRSLADDELRARLFASRRHGRLGGGAPDRDSWGFSQAL